VTFYAFSKPVSFVSLVAATLILQGCVTTSDLTGSTPDDSSEKVQNVSQTDLAPPGHSIAIATRPSQEIGQSDAGHYLAALIAQKNQDVDRASYHYRKALELKGDDSRFRHLAYFFTLAKGDFDGAVQLALGNQDTSYKDTLLPILLMTDAVDKGHMDEALSIAKSTPPSALAEMSVPLFKAWIAADRNAYEDALLHLAPLGQQPLFKGVHNLHAGLIADVTGHLDSAIRFLSSRETLGDSPNLRTVQMLASALYRNGQEDKAFDLLDKFFESSPNLRLGLSKEAYKTILTTPSIRNTKDGLAESLFTLAFFVNEQGAKEVALAYTQMALKLRPDFSLGNFLLGEIFSAQQQYTQANAAFEKVSETSWVYHSARLNLAENYTAMDQHDAALRILTSLTEQFPDDPQTWIKIGDTYRADKQYAQAATAYSAAIRHLGTANESHWGLYYARGVMYEQAGAWEKAEQDLKTSLKLSPEQPFTLNYLGYSWLDRGENLKEAEAMIRKAVALRPYDGFIIDSLGWALLLLDDMPGAIENLERAVELTPEDPTINSHLGDAYWLVGRKNEARFQWTRALSLEKIEKNKDLITDRLENGITLDKIKAEQQK
jgi:tetratricopeptide (TPR) repeat protein